MAARLPPPHRRLRIALGTWVAIEASAPDGERAAAAIEAAFGAIAKVERRMHPTREGSDLARINRAAASTSVHRSTWKLLALAKRLQRLSGGVFDPCLPERPGRLDDIELLPQWQVRCLAPVSLDFGGFAKGYAVDCAIAALERRGCSAGLVNAGGDLRVFGPREQTLLVREANGSLSPLRLTTGAVAVSMAAEQRRPAEHRGYYRRSDTAAAAAPPRVTRAVVIAPRAVMADALTKCVLLGEPALTARMLRGLGASEVGTPRAPPCEAHSPAQGHAGARTAWQQPEVI
jgi:FAD:protein FMN transferase